MNIPMEIIERRIYLFRGQNVMLDSDLAELYGVSTGALNQAVSRNMVCFPEDFMFALTVEETSNLISQVVISSSGHGGRRTKVRVFTEQGVAMLSSVLRSQRAVRVNIQIMRTFVNLRRLLATNEELARKLTDLERNYDAKFRVVFDAIRRLMEPPEDPQHRRIGYSSED